MSVFDLSVVIVTYDSADFIEDCLASVFAEVTDDFALEVFVIDNNSGDGSADIVARDFPRVTLIRNDENRGFAAANNQGLKQSQGRNVILLNPDTWVFPGALRAMSRCLDEHPEVGAVGPRAWVDKERTLEICIIKPLTVESALAQLTPLGRLWPMRKLTQGIWESDWEFFERRDKPLSVTGIGGAYFMTRRTLAESFGWLDERFFLGYEDDDWSRLVLAAGKWIEVLPDAEIVHYFGQSKRKHLLQTDPLFHWQQGLLTLLRKHEPAWKVNAFVALMTALGGLQQVRNWTQKPAQLPPKLISRDTLTIKWERSERGPYLFEFSNTSRFIDKWAKICDEPSLVLSKDVLAKILPGVYHWRVTQIGAGPARTILASGEVHISTCSNDVQGDG